MATSPERTLENSIVSAVESLAYINANSIPVRNWDDQDDARALPCVTVGVFPRSRIAPNYNFYRLPVEVRVYRHRGDDPNQAVSDQIYEEVAAWAYARRSSLAFGDDRLFSGNGAPADATVRATNGDGGEWTIACTFKPNSGTGQTLMTFGGYNVDGWVELYWSGDSLRLLYGNVTNNLSCTISGISLNEWHQVIVTFDGGTTGNVPGDINDYYGRFGFWLDGQSVATTNAHSNFGYTGAIGQNYWIIGGLPTGQYLQSGFELGQIGIWDSDETANASNIFNGGAARSIDGFTTTPQALYSFNDRDNPNNPEDAAGYKDLLGAGFTASDYKEGFGTVGVSADGITYNDGTEEEQDSFHFRGVSFDIYDTIT